MIKIVSGGQTGVDRGALDAAIKANIECGGWCPEGRKAEDGVISPKYPLTELKGASYLQRTLQNVIDSDGTLIIYFGYLSGGTEKTLDFCIKNKKPYKLIDAQVISEKIASTIILSFVKDKNISILNVAGPRASSNPNRHAFTKDALYQYLDFISSI